MQRTQRPLDSSVWTCISPPRGPTELQTLRLQTYSYAGPFRGREGNRRQPADSTRHFVYAQVSTWRTPWFDRVRSAFEPLIAPADAVHWAETILRRSHGCRAGLFPGGAGPFHRIR